MTTRNSLLLEACVDSLADALSAERCGANRIELCSALDQDGLTPSIELTRHCVTQLSIPMMAMVRPRGGNFVYSEAEIAEMEKEIEQFKKLGVTGVVFGLLTKDGNIDLMNTQKLAKLAFPLEITFHKAIDYSKDILKSFQEINSITEITKVLTSGGKDTAWNGRLILKAMNEMSERRIKVIAAGKILPENAIQIAEFTGVRELHGKRIV
jgi:copper homeostasis protein